MYLKQLSITHVDWEAMLSRIGTHFSLNKSVGIGYKTAQKAKEGHGESGNHHF